MNPELSVVLATPDRYATIRKTVRHLLTQTVRDRLELVIVAPSRRGLELDATELKPFESFQVVEVGRVESLGTGNAAGIRAARAPVVALLEDHSRPERGWAEALLAAHGAEWAAVGPAMGNPNPRSALSWADFLLAFSTWWIPTESREIDHLPTHNGSYKRQLLLTYGAELETLLAAEIVLQWDLVRRGHRLYVAADARLYHVNFEKLSSWIPLKIHAGRVFAAVRSRRWSPIKRALYVCGSPLIPVVGLRHVLGQIRRRPGTRLPRSVYPLLGLGLVTSAFGEAWGYALGMGNAARDLGHFEFHRERHLRRGSSRS